MFGIIDLIHKPMLNVDAPRIGAHQITGEFLKGGRVLKRILRDNVEEFLGLRFEIRQCNPLRVLARLPGVNNRPTHQPGFFDNLESGSAMPLRMDSRMPGIETR